MQDAGREHITPDIPKRQYRRAKLVAQVNCEALGKEDLMVTRDVSAGGLALSAKKAYPLGSEVAVSFQLHPSGQPISCRGKVVYSAEGMGMGIQFIDLSEESRQALQKFIDEAN